MHTPSPSLTKRLIFFCSSVFIFSVAALTLYSVCKIRYQGENGELISYSAQYEYANVITYSNEPVHSFNKPLNDNDVFPLPHYFSKMTTKNWLKSDFIFKKFDPSKNTFPVCPGGVVHNPHANSTPRDLIISLVSGSYTNFMTYIRTLRSTGCKATVVVLIDDKCYHKLSNSEKKVLDSCGVNLIKYGDINLLFKKYIYETRLILMYGIILTYRKQFDRVMIIDIFDTIFQSDPFIPGFNNQSMFFTTEGYYNNFDPTNNTKWIKVADPDYYKDVHFYDDKIVINGGLFFGSIDGMLLFFKLFLSLDVFNDFTVETVDQGYMNYLYHRGIFMKNGLNLTLTFPGDYIISARGHKFSSNKSPDGLIMMLHSSNPPAVIHQFNRDTSVLNSIKKTCPSFGEGDQIPFPVYKS